MNTPDVAVTELKSFITADTGPHPQKSQPCEHMAYIVYNLQEPASSKTEFGSKQHTSYIQHVPVSAVHICTLSCTSRMTNSRSASYSLLLQSMAIGRHFLPGGVLSPCPFVLGIILPVNFLHSCRNATLQHFSQMLCQFVNIMLVKAHGRLDFDDGVVVAISGYKNLAGFQAFLHPFGSSRCWHL